VTVGGTQMPPRVSTGDRRWLVAGCVDCVCGLAACKRGRDGTLLSTTTPPPQPIAPQQPRPAAADSGQVPAPPASAAKKPRMVFTEIQRRTLVAIFKEIKRPSKEIQATIAEQLGLKVSTVVNFFMNARRRSVDKYMDETPSSSAGGGAGDPVSSTAPGPVDDGSATGRQ